MILDQDGGVLDVVDEAALHHATHGHLHNSVPLLGSNAPGSWLVNKYLSNSDVNS